MDVVRTNVERIGGSVEMISRTGQGSTCRICVPLTLVIVPALVVEASGQMFAIPQASLAELLRITPEREARMISDLGGTPVLRLRGEVVPLVDLAAVLQSGEVRRAADGGRSVVVLRSQGRTFALLVDDVADTEEIVVKPLARQLQQLGVYSGATVRGDGRVALVLDVNGLARRANVLEEGEGRAAASAAVEAAASTRRTYLVLRGADDGRLAIPLGEVRRLEEIDPADIEPLGTGEAVQYRGAILPLVRLSEALPERRQRPRVAVPPTAGEKLPVVVQSLGGRDVGLVVDTVLDVVEEAVTLDTTRARAGVVGCAVIQGRITEVLDTSALLSAQLSRPEAAHG
jgi:two-component system chemotaxis sensor kinase CheA